MSHQISSPEHVGVEIRRLRADALFARPGARLHPQRHRSGLGRAQRHRYLRCSLRRQAHARARPVEFSSPRRGDSHPRLHRPLQLVPTLDHHPLRPPRPQALPLPVQREAQSLLHLEPRRQRDRRSVHHQLRPHDRDPGLSLLLLDLRVDLESRLQLRALRDPQHLLVVQSHALVRRRHQHDLQWVLPAVHDPPPYLVWHPGHQLLVLHEAAHQEVVRLHLQQTPRLPVVHHPQSIPLRLPDVLVHPHLPPLMLVRRQREIALQRPIPVVLPEEFPRRRVLPRPGREVLHVDPPLPRVRRPHEARLLI